MRHITLAIALTLLCGCLGGGGGSSPKPVQSIEVGGTGGTWVVSASGRFDLTVSGTAVTVTIAAGQRVRNLTVSGVGADVLVGSTSTVSGTVTVSGTNAVLHLPPTSTINANITGTGATVVYDSTAG